MAQSGASSQLQPHGSPRRAEDGTPGPESLWGRPSLSASPGTTLPIEPCLGPSGGWGLAFLRCQQVPVPSRPQTRPQPPPAPALSLPCLCETALTHEALISSSGVAHGAGGCLPEELLGLSGPSSPPSPSPPHFPPLLSLTTSFLPSVSFLPFSSFPLCSFPSFSPSSLPPNPPPLHPFSV